MIYDILILKLIKTQFFFPNFSPIIILYSRYGILKLEYML